MRTTLFLLLLSSLFNYSNAQGFSEYESGMKIKINQDGSKYLRIINWQQFWVKSNENNSGSTLLGKSIDNTVDFGIRRIRLLMYSQLSDRFLILTHFGINNQNAFSGGATGAGGKKPQLFFHDAYVDYTIFKNYLNVGAGLHYWNGISRMNSTSTLNFLTQDAPIFNWPTIDKADQFARYMGVFAKGKIKKFDYRIAANDPFQANDTKVIAKNVADFNPYATTWNTSGYFNYQIFDQESNLLPYFVGTYLGSKKVLNIGLGFQHQKDGMWYKNDVGDTLNHNQLLLGADVFLDMPINKSRKDAITFYGVYYNYNFGPNYVRSIGVLNPADGGGALRGNSLPTVGTGQILYGQLGYLLPEFSQKLKVQPYAAFSQSRFEGLKNSAGKIVPVNTLDAGINLFMAGHHSKITLNYRARPDFTSIESVDYKNEFTLQFMIYL
jgi:hypothetical protein